MYEDIYLHKSKTLKASPLKCGFTTWPCRIKRVKNKCLKTKLLRLCQNRELRACHWTCRLLMYRVLLTQRGFKLREELAQYTTGQPLPSSIYLLPDTPQIKGLHTFIRNKDTPRDEFIFYSKRLIRLVIEYALSLLPFKVLWRCLIFLFLCSV